MDIALVELSQNREIVRTMQQISNLVIHAASQTTASRPKLEEAVGEHRTIIEALRAKDPGATLAAIRDHCLGVRRRLMGMSQ